jgi:hypothetical protein
MLFEQLEGFLQFNYPYNKVVLVQIFPLLVDVVINLRGTPE